MKITIHQPNFIPWYPFFQKIEEADIFIILTHCQFEKNNYQNRFNANNQWYTMRVKKGMNHIINKTSNFDECITDNLATTNVNIIKKACKLLNITTKIKFDSPTDLNGTARLVDLCKKYNGTEYLSGIGGKNYLQPELFKKEDIKISYQTNLIKKPLFEILNYE